LGRDAQGVIVARQHGDAHAPIDERARHGETDPARRAGHDGRPRLDHFPSYST
jgi:hypothetical protein